MRLKSKFNIKFKGNPKKVIVIIGPCRSGSTALLNALSIYETNGVFQPFKTAARREKVKDSETVLVKADKDVLVIKEALGPYYTEETDYYFIRELIDQYGAENINLVALVRDPKPCLGSWIRGFGQNKNLELSTDVFIKAYQKTFEAYEYARSCGIKSICATQDDMGEPGFIEKLANKLNINYHPSMDNWQIAGKPKNGSYHFQKPAEPPLFQVAGLLDGTKYGKALDGKKRTKTLRKIITFSENERKAINEAREFYYKIQRNSDFNPTREHTIRR